MRSTPTALNAEAAGASLFALRLADLVKLAHLSACLGIPPSYLSAPPTLLPLSSFCSRSAALACAQAEPSVQRSWTRCCASSKEGALARTHFVWSEPGRGGGPHGLDLCVARRQVMVTLAANFAVGLAGRASSSFGLPPTLRLRPRHAAGL